MSTYLHRFCSTQEGSPWSKSSSSPGEGANSLHLSLYSSSPSTGIIIVSKYIWGSSTFFPWFGPRGCWQITGFRMLIILIFIYFNHLLLFSVQSCRKFLNRGPVTVWRCRFGWIWPWHRPGFDRNWHWAEQWFDCPNLNLEACSLGKGPFNKVWGNCNINGFFCFVDPISVASLSGSRGKLIIHS